MKSGKRKKIIFWSAISVGFAAIATFTGVKLYNYLSNKEGSSLWYKKANLVELEKYREKIGEQYANAGLNNISEEEFTFLEKELHKLDCIIINIKNVIFEREHPNIPVRHREHGWYLPNDD